MIDSEYPRKAPKMGDFVRGLVKLLISFSLEVKEVRASVSLPCSMSLAKMVAGLKNAPIGEFASA